MAAKKKTPQDSPSGEEPLRDQLFTAVESLSDEDVLFLLKQAQTMIYNNAVDEQNRAAEKLNNTMRKSKQPAAKKGEVPQSQTESGDVAIEQSSSGKSYVLVVRNQRKSLDPNEMTKLVSIAHDTDDPREGIPRLLRWLRNHRDDVILDGGLSGRDPAMLELYRLLREKFTITRE